MDYEKAYKDALERAKEFQKSKDGLCVLTAESIFPELQESEDERIRKAIIAYIKKANGGPNHILPSGTYSVLAMIFWLEKQGKKKAIMNVPSREVILSIWDLGNEWKELTNGSISTEYGTQLDYIQKHWHESEYYLREKQGEQKPVNDTVETIVEAVSNTSILDMIEDKMMLNE